MKNLLSKFKTIFLRYSRQRPVKCFGKRFPDIFPARWYGSISLRWVAVISAKKHKRQRRKRQSVTVKTIKVANAKVLNRNTNIT